MPERVGTWLQTYTGKAFWPLDPRPEDICIEDIAYSLAGYRRFGAHAKPRITVGQHSLHVSNLSDPQDALAGLLHDASEAYLGDMTRPVKMLEAMAPYRKIEKRVQEAIFERFGLEPVLPPSVRRADEIALATEKRDCMSEAPHDWELTAEPNPERIMLLDEERVERAFLYRFNALMGGRK